jgi:hypothetical protein
VGCPRRNWYGTDRELQDYGRRGYVQASLIAGKLRSPFRLPDVSTIYLLRVLISDRVAVSLLYDRMVY